MERFEKIFAVCGTLRYGSAVRDICAVVDFRFALFTQCATLRLFLQCHTQISGMHKVANIRQFFTEVPTTRRGTARFVIVYAIERLTSRVEGRLLKKTTHGSGQY